MVIEINAALLIRNILIASGCDTVSIGKLSYTVSHTPKPSDLTPTNPGTAKKFIYSNGQTLKSITGYTIQAQFGNPSTATKSTNDYVVEGVFYE